MAAARPMRFEVLRLFRERGIEIPFPQRDVHLRGLEGPPSAAGGRAPANPIR